MKKFWIFIVFLLIIVWIFSIVAKPQNNELTKVKVGEVTHSIFYTPWYVALENNYFKDEVFGNINIQEQLVVNKNTATSYIKILTDNNLIEPVTGHGKGKYKFK